MSADVFCPLPWVSQATRNDGVFRICAHAQNSPCRGEARTSNGEVMAANTHNWDDAQNAHSLKQVRSDFLKNQWPQACVRCKEENQVGIASRQAEELKRYKGIFEKSDAFQVTENDGTLKRVGPVELDLRFGNRCNLKCTMCSPKSSDMWYGDHQRVWGPRFKNWNEETVVISKDIRSHENSTMNQWYESAHFMDELQKRLSTVRTVHFTGGEPVVIQRFYDVLDAIVDFGTASETTIEFITNGTALPHKLQKYFDQFKEIKIGVSIDAIGEKNEYIRFPSQWNKTLNTLKILDQSPTQVHAWIVATTMIYNIIDLPEIIEWRDQMNFLKVNNNNTRTLLSDHPLHNPAHLSVQILPRDVKMAVARKLNAYLDTKKSFASSYLQSHQQLALENIKSLIESNIRFMLAEDRSALLPKFLKYTERLDQERGNSFWSTFPEMSNLLAPYLEKKIEHENRA